MSLSCLSVYLPTIRVVSFDLSSNFVNKMWTIYILVFLDWRELIDRDRFADCVIICTQDQQHKVSHSIHLPAVHFIDRSEELCEN